MKVSPGEGGVLGARFTRWQGAAGGRVRLHRGSIRFEPAGRGPPRTLAPGDELTWPLAAGQSPYPAGAGPAPKVRRPTHRARASGAAQAPAWRLAWVSQWAWALGLA